MDKVEKNVETYPKKNNKPTKKSSQRTEYVLKELYMTQPYHAAYETNFNGKEKYNEIVQQFENTKKYLTDENSIGWYLMALIDTLENFSEEIFEYYRHLQLIFKEIIEKVLSQKNEKESAMITYVVMKGIRLGHLSEEYLESSVKNFESLVHQKENVDVSSFVKAHREYQYLKK